MTAEANSVGPLYRKPGCCDPCNPEKHNLVERRGGLGAACDRAIHLHADKAVRCLCYPTVVDSFHSTLVKKDETGEGCVRAGAGQSGDRDCATDGMSTMRATAAVAAGHACLWPHHRKPGHITPGVAALRQAWMDVMAGRETQVPLTRVERQAPVTCEREPAAQDRWVVP